MGTLDDRELVERNLALVEGMKSAGQAAEKLGVSKKKLLDWRAGEIALPLREPLKSKLVSNLSERNGTGMVRESHSPYTLAPTPAVLAILRIDAEAARSRAQAAKEWAVAERIAQENTRALRIGLVSAGDAEQEAIDRAARHKMGEEERRSTDSTGEEGPSLPTSPPPDRAPKTPRRTDR